MDFIFAPLQQPLTQSTADKTIDAQDQNLLSSFLLYSLPCRSSKSHAWNERQLDRELLPYHVDTALDLTVADHNGILPRRNRQGLGRDHRSWQILPRFETDLSCLPKKTFPFANEAKSP